MTKKKSDEPEKKKKADTKKADTKKADTTKKSAAPAEKADKASKAADKASKAADKSDKANKASKAADKTSKKAKAPAPAEAEVSDATQSEPVEDTIADAQPAADVDTANAEATAAEASRSTAADGPRKRKPPTKPPLKTLPPRKKPQPQQQSPQQLTTTFNIAEKLDASNGLSPEMLQKAFVEALQGAGLPTGKGQGATPAQFADALPRILEGITQSMAGVVRERLVPQLQQIEGLQEVAEQIAQQQLQVAPATEAAEVPPGDEPRDAEPSPEADDLANPAPEIKDVERVDEQQFLSEARKALGLPEPETLPPPAPPEEPLDPELANMGSELGRTVRESVEEYVRENVAEPPPPGEAPTVHVDADFLRTHGGKLLGTALGALARALVPAAEQLGQRIAQGPGAAPASPKPAEPAEPPPPPAEGAKKKPVNFQVDLPGIVASLISGTRSAQNAARRRPQKVEQPPREPDDDGGST